MEGKTTYQLRKYQQEMVDIGLEKFKQGKPFILQAATGAGKSLVIAALCHALDEPVLVLQPSKELLLQNYEKMLSYDIKDVKLYSASVGTKEIGRFVMATIGSIYKKPDLFKHFKYVIIDECHEVNPRNFNSMYGSFLKAIKCTSVCGLTATPYRIMPKYFQQNGNLFCSSSLKMLTRIAWPTFWAGGIVFKIETQELIQQGYLSPITYHIAEVDLSDLQVNSTGQNYTDDSLEVFWNDKRLRALGEVIREIDRTCKRNLIFCSSIRQATRATTLLNDNGILAKMVTGMTPAKEREQIVADFRSGKVKHLVNMGVFTTGFDVPELDSIVLARPTMSLGLYYQMVGRGVRLDPQNPGKTLHVHDLAGCVHRLGTVESIRITKMDDGFKDEVTSSAGVMTEYPLFVYQVPLKERKKVNYDAPRY